MTCLHDVKTFRVLQISNQHRPSDFKFGTFSWGSCNDWGGLGIHWVWCYEEDPDYPDEPIPDWLLKICIDARDIYRCEYVMFDDAAPVYSDWPTFNDPT